MKKIILSIIFIFLSRYSYASDIPIFNMPPNNYKLFTHNSQEANQNINQAENQTSSQINDIQISGIFKSGGEYFALINHKVCKKGDEINGYTIKQITNNKVVFVKDGVESVKILTSKPNIIFFSDDTISNDNDTKH